MPIKRLYSYACAAGAFDIYSAGRWYFAMFENRALALHAAPEKVALALALRFGLAPCEEPALDIPADLRKWRKVE